MASRMTSQMICTKFKLVTLMLLFLWGIPWQTAQGQDSLPEPTSISQLANGVTLKKWELQEPKPQCIQAVVIDTKVADVRVDYTLGGGDPDGSGPYHATGMSVFTAAEQYGYDLAINADELVTSSKLDNATKHWGKIDVACMVHGQWLVRTPDYPLMTLRINRDGRFQISSTSEYPADTLHVIRGHYQPLLKDGKILFKYDKADASAKTPNPRTAFGLDETGTVVTILVVDGRQSERAVGFTTQELQNAFLALGVTDALTLGGGGNTTLVGRMKKDSPLRILSTPSDRNVQGFVTLRENVTTLGFRIYGD